MKMTKRIISLIFILAFCTSLMAQGNLGQAGANFLQIAVDARSAALGGAVTASTIGAEALYWNPAGATRVENMDIMLGHTSWFMDTKIAFGAIVKNFQNFGAIGFSVTSFYMDKMEVTTPYASDGTDEYFEAGDISLGVSYARDLTSHFTFGVSAKYVHEYIWNETASQIAFDIGSIYQTGFYNLRIGMVIRNVSGNMEFKGDDIDDRIAEEEAEQIPNNPRLERLTPEFRLPQVFQMGIAFDPLVTESTTLTVFTDVDVPSDNEQRVIIGSEYAFRNFAFLRAAYRMNYDLGDYAFGAGLNLQQLGVDSRLDYSYSSHGELGDVHRFSLGLSL